MTRAEIIYVRVAEEEEAYAVARRLSRPDRSLDIDGPHFRPNPEGCARVLLHSGDALAVLSFAQARQRFA